MAQWLRAPAAVPKNRGSDPSTHMAAHNHLQLQFQGISCLLAFLPSSAPSVHAIDSQTYKQTPRVIEFRRTKISSHPSVTLSQESPLCQSIRYMFQLPGNVNGNWTLAHLKQYLLDVPADRLPDRSKNR